MMPKQAAAPGGAERKSLKLSCANGGRPRLLLAEDYEPVRIVTAAMLKAMGCDVEAVVHGEQAVRSASETRFDVIVLDIEMPIMDGITAARSIRRLGGIASATPLMALSAFLADSVRSGHWRDTFDIALPKPANRNELHGAVTTALACRRPGADPGGELPPSVIDAAALALLQSGISARIWRQLATIACRDIAVCLDQLERGIPAGQNGAMMSFVDKLAGLGRTFAAPRLAWAAERVRVAPSEGARCEELRVLAATARDTVAALGG